jgi:3-oxoadipate enol-lactonase
VPTAAVNGIDVSYERQGEGAPLLFLNGSGATIESMRALLDLVAARCELLVHDPRGLGRTTIPPGPYSMADDAQDALGLLDHVGWRSCRVIGVSFGGMVAQELAVTAPERVERLALVCTSPGGAMPSYPLHELALLRADERAREYLPLLDTRFTGGWLAEHASDRALVEMLAARFDARKSDEVLRGEREQLEARRHHDVLERLERITAPTLVAAGRFDGIAPFPNSEAIARGIPRAELRVYEGGHAFFAQDPRALPDLTEFLGA